MAVIVLAAMTAPHRTWENMVFNRANATGRVAISFENSTRTGHRNEFQVQKKLISATVTAMGMIMGNMMRYSIRKWCAPSMSAASMKSSGMLI